jgi:dTDP-4-dehydrorhamnose reductase
MSVRPRILLTGGTGQIGWEALRALAPLAEVVAPTRAELDLGDPVATRAAVAGLRPAAVVNCAAYTDVEHAEDDASAAQALNAEAPAVLAAAAARAGALMVHFSTDYVFDGASTVPYAEADEAAPLNVYGRTKREGELAVAAAGGPHLVLRTSWVYGLRGRNFLRTMLRLAAEHDELRVVDDQTGSPTWSRMIAGGLSAILARLCRGGRFTGDAAPWGTYHLAAGGETTWHGFAAAILAARPRGDGRVPRVKAVTTAAFGARATRPAYSVLDCARTDAAFGVRLPDWSSQLRLVLDER